MFALVLPIARGVLLTAIVIWIGNDAWSQKMLRYVPAPAGNPMKGLVPYAGDYRDRFPHSLEFGYVPLSELVVGEKQYRWDPLERLLDSVADRGHQTVFRVWIEYPGHSEGVPAFLEKNGLQVTRWKHSDTGPAKFVRTPNYNDASLRMTLRDFIAELGKRYDGDPRIGYITAGLLGLWGEWHNYPRVNLMPNKEVQTEVMDAYERAFRQTPVLLRYPAGPDDWAYAENQDRPFGYHDDSFAWATLDTGRNEDNWFYMSALKRAGVSAQQKWTNYPIGGEIRPELWGQIFDSEPANSMAQDFAFCVQQTHATWLMDSGMFRSKQPSERVASAKQQVSRMGYEFHIQSVEITRPSRAQTRVTLRVANTGVAPFYHPWKVEIAPVYDVGLGKPVSTDWKVTGLLPGDNARDWTIDVANEQPAVQDTPFAIRIVNPLPGGIPLRFANEYPDDSPPGWWLIP